MIPTYTTLRRVRSRRWTTIAAAIFPVLSTAGPAGADDNNWTGGSGSNWTSGSGGNNWSLSPGYWQNQFIDCAFFNTSLNTSITLTTPISLRGMSVTGSGFSITGSGANVLTLTAGFGGSL